MLCVSLALIPLFSLYGLSVGTSIHVFVPRYRLVAVPGIALCWALVVSWIDSRALRLLFCAALVTVAACVYFTAPSFQRHMYSWKDALAFAEKNASTDNAPLLICSDIPEADHMRMPVGSAIEETGILPPLSYYKVSVPVTPLPRGLNDEAVRAGSEFLQQQAQRHQRFLALAFVQSIRDSRLAGKGSCGHGRCAPVGGVRRSQGVRVCTPYPERCLTLIQTRDNRISKDRI